MTKITSGTHGRAAYCLEGTYGTTPSAPTVCSFGSVTGMSQDVSANYTPYYGLGQVMPPFVKKGNREVGLSVEGLAHDNTLFEGTQGKAYANAGILRYAIGWDSTNKKIALRKYLDSMTVEQKTGFPPDGETDHILRFKGCKVNSLTLEASVGEPISFSADLISKDNAESTSEFASVPEPIGDPLMAYEGDVILTHNTTVKTLENCSDWSIEISRNLERKFHVKAADPIIYDLPETQCEITASLTLDFTSKDEYHRFMNDETFDIKFEMGQKGDGTALHWITLKNCKWSAAAYDLSDTDLVAQDCELFSTKVLVDA